jgi:hypothetical protein
MVSRGMMFIQSFMNIRQLLSILLMWEAGKLDDLNFNIK